MKAVLIWRNCSLFKKKQDGFWVQCPSSEIEQQILPYLSVEQRARFLEGKQHFLSTKWANLNPGLLVDPDSYYFMISRDGNEIQSTDPFYPYSSQWNAYCPLELISTKIIDSIKDLKEIRMGVPDFQSFFKPLLDIAGDNKEHSMKESREIIAKILNMTESDLKELLPSGTQTKYDNRVAWAKSYFVQAKVLESPRRGYFRITERGKDLLKKGYDRIDVKILNEYPEFKEFHTAKADHSDVKTADTVSIETPEEALQKAYFNIRGELASEILGKIKANTPKFFERLVVDLMLALGYGGSRSDAGKSVGQSGDEGIDGIIKEDRLGLDVIYLQAKRWDGSVGRPEIQKFVGALHGKRAKKGVFITTGHFSEEAIKYVEHIDPKVILIDGRTLAELIIDHDIGTTTSAKYEIKRIDSDYYAED